jgi:alkaline phosphatase
MGGGRKNFITTNDKDFLADKKGLRIDNRNLINEWNMKMEKTNLKHKFLWNYTDFTQLKPSQYDHVLGLIKHKNFLKNFSGVI